MYLPSCFFLTLLFQFYPSLLYSHLLSCSLTFLYLFFLFQLLIYCLYF
jgi:hypothetical protein